MGCQCDDFLLEFHNFAVCHCLSQLCLLQFDLNLLLLGQEGEVSLRSLDILSLDWSESGVEKTIVIAHHNTLASDSFWSLAEELVLWVKSGQQLDHPLLLPRLLG